MKLSLVVVPGCILAMLISGCEEDGSSTSAENTVLKIYPAAVYLNATKTSAVQLTAIGGNGSYTNYTWSVSTNSLGTISGSGETALYQNTTNTGYNTVRVADSSGNAGTATVTQN